MFEVARTASTFALTMKWDVALRMIALTHILVLQNRMLRGQPSALQPPPTAGQVFRVTGGMRASLLVGEWDAAVVGVRCAPAADGASGLMELALDEELAAEWLAALATTIALNGTAAARQRGERQPGEVDGGRRAHLNDEV